MKVLITGGAGFIGSNLAERCLNLGHEVYIIDDLSTGSLDNIRHLQNHHDFAEKLHVTIDTILNREVVHELVNICDKVIHLAAAVGVRYILENPLTSIITNIQGTENVLEFCNKFRKKVVVASSSEVYGKHLHAPLVETDNIIYGPPELVRWSYAGTKLIDEFTALAYYKTKQLPVIIIRLFNTIGPRQRGRYGMVVPRFIQQALRNDPITVYGDGSQTRTFTYVDDVVEAIMNLLACPGAIGQIINIGGSEEISIKSLADVIKQMTGSHSEIKLIPYEDAYNKEFEDMHRRVPSIEKLCGLLGWKPNTSLQDMLWNLIEYYRSR